MTSHGEMSNPPPNPKFGVPGPPDDGRPSSIPYAYPNVYEIEQTTGPQRLVLAPAADHIGLLRDLAAELRGPFGVLYVLVLSRRGEHAAGRYQSLPVEDLVLASFLEEHRCFLEGDGRHHLWVTSVPTKATLVYDRHNVIYAYGPLDSFRHAAEAHGLSRGTVQLPFPHVHNYNPAFDAEERRILAHWEWKHFPLRETDDL